MGGTGDTNQTVPLLSISTKVIAIALHHTEHLNERPCFPEPFPYKYIYIQVYLKIWVLLLLLLRSTFIEIEQKIRTQQNSPRITRAPQQAI